jgi:TonB family protein
MKQEKKKAEAKPEPKAEPRPEPKKREDDKAAAERKAAEARESELQRKLVEAEREAEAKAAAERAAEKAAADKAAAERAAKAAALQQELQRYRVNIIAKIRSRMVKFEGNMEAVFTVQLFPGGELQAVNMVRSSGNTEFDAAVRQAINQSQPFVVPTGELFHQHFRPLTLTFRP